MLKQNNTITKEFHRVLDIELLNMIALNFKNEIKERNFYVIFLTA